MLGTAGNLSARIGGGTRSNEVDCFWITASGLAKGQLEENDFLRIAVESGEVIESGRPDAQPSAETSIHRSIYVRFPDARACLHVHTVEACLATRNVSPAQNHVLLPALEMVKGLGIWDEAPTASLPLFANHGDVRKISEEIEIRFAQQDPLVPALMVRGHGVTVWGRSIQEATNRLECLEFILSYMARC
jgi:methylthioribulose-1-phosphate dehydratase